tara:strand:- start:771 stop:2207 length:1437 start_codon:yes stop_codon:yes gene_type:complete
MMSQQSHEREERILVISDIHLGEDILQEGPEKLSEYIKRLNFELSSFIRGHLQSEEESFRWRLIINGDLFDFLKVGVEEEDFADADKSVAGETVWKLHRIVEIHRPIFKALAEFVSEGHRLTVIEGNHDAELYFKEVKDAFRKEIFALCPGTSSEEQAKFESRIEFCTWFHAKIGRFHIEHGHQYDPLCAFAHLLAPFDKNRKDLAIPIIHRGIAPFAEVLTDFSTHGLEKWGLLDYLKFGFSQSPKVLYRAALVYFRIAFDMVVHSGKKREEELAEFKTEHESALGDMAQEDIYGLPVLKNLDALKAKPAEYSWFKIFHALFLDRLALVVMLPILVILSFLCFSGLQVLWAILTSLGLVLGGISLLNSVNRSDSEHELRSAATRISRLTGARFVIFGHSHYPELKAISAQEGGAFGDSCFYINTGSWVTREIINDPPLGMTYAELNAEGGFLKRWQSRATPEVLFSSKELQRGGQAS